MRAVIFFTVFLGVIFSAQAQMFFWPVNPSTRLEKTESQNYELVYGYFSSAGFFNNPWYFTLESEQFESKSSEGNVSIKRKYQDLSLWAGYNLLQKDSWNFLFMTGLGLYKEDLKTQVGSLTETNTGKDKNLFGLGTEALFMSSSYFTISGGARIYWGYDRDPQPQPSLYLKLGLFL